MQIGIYINNNWIPAILNANQQGFVIKMETSSIIINFKELVSCRINNQNFIELFYITMKNAETIKNKIIINSDNIEETFNILTTKPSKDLDNHNNENKFMHIEKEEIKNTQEFIDKQNQLNNQKIVPKKKTPIIIAAIITVIISLLGTIILKNNSINNEETFKNLFWSNQNETNDYFTYEFLEDDKCRYSHHTKDGKIIDDCTYQLNNKKITISYENGQKIIYKWKISYTIKNFKIKIMLNLNDEIFFSK